MPKTTQEIYKELLQRGQDYQNQANDYLNQYDNRDPFKFDLENNALYNQYKQQYQLAGQKAMKDTMGQAAGLTGGYANSYAQNVGQQAYDDYLTKLNAIVPELYAQERSYYDQAGKDLLNRYNISLSAANDAYGQARDALGDLRYEDEQAWNRDWQQKQWDYNTQQQSQSDARSYATYLLQMGIMPSAEQLAAAGISPQEATSIQNYYNMQMAGSVGGSTGGGSSYQSTGGGNGSGELGNTGNGKFIKEWQITNLLSIAEKNGLDAALAELDRSYKGFSNYNPVATWLRQNVSKGDSGTYDTLTREIRGVMDAGPRDSKQWNNMVARIDEAYSKGLITQKQANDLYAMLGMTKEGKNPTNPRAPSPYNPRTEIRDY